MKRLIILDIETTEAHSVGQILNMAAVAVDENFNITDTFYREVKISKTQLPEPEAILVNRVNVLTHQNTATHTEKEALQDLANFIEHYKENYNTIVAGQNIARFDLEYLSSNSFRSGVYPYFGGVSYTDLMYLSKKLVVTNETFRNLLTKEDGKISISLSWITGQLNLRSLEQSHNSLDDVKLTLEVFKKYNTDFNLNVFDYEAYEPKGTYYQGDILDVGMLEKQAVIVKQFAFHSQDKRGALWLNLTDYSVDKGKQNLRWFNKKNSSFIVNDYNLSEELSQQALAILQLPEYQLSVTDRLFPESDCDPEINVKSIRPDIIKASLDYMNSNTSALLESFSDQVKELPEFKNSLTFVKRYMMLYANTTAADKFFKDYVFERYNGGMKIVKSANSYNSNRPQVHPTLKERLAKIERLLIEKTDPEDINLLISLKTFIMNSEIVKQFPELLIEEQNDNAGTNC